MVEIFILARGFFRKEAIAIHSRAPTLCANDVIEADVDASFFLSEDKVRKLLIAVPPEQLMKVGYLKEQAQ